MNTYAPGAGASIAIEAGDVLVIVIAQSGIEQRAHVVSVRKDGRPVVQWVSSTLARTWMSKPRVLRAPERIVRRAAPFEAAEYRRQVEQIEGTAERVA